MAELGRATEWENASSLEYCSSEKQTYNATGSKSALVRCQALIRARSNAKFANTGPKPNSDLNSSHVLRHATTSVSNPQSQILNSGVTNGCPKTITLAILCLLPMSSWPWPLTIPRPPALSISMLQHDNKMNINGRTWMQVLEETQQREETKEKGTVGIDWPQPSGLPESRKSTSTQCCQGPRRTLCDHGMPRAQERSHAGWQLQRDAHLQGLGST